MNRRPVDPRSTMNHPRDIKPNPPSLWERTPRGRLVAIAAVAIGAVAFLGIMAYMFATGTDMQSNPTSFGWAIVSAAVLIAGLTCLTPPGNR